jgi:hypothetical protein
MGEGPTYSAVIPQNDEWLLLNHYARQAFYDADVGTLDGPSPSTCTSRA